MVKEMKRKDRKWFSFESEKTKILRATLVKNDQFIINSSNLEQYFLGQHIPL